MKVLYPITLDCKKTNIQKTIQANTGEGNERQLVITLVSGNKEIELTNERVSVCGVKPDGTGFANTATINEDGKIEYTLTTQNVAAAGDVDCQIRVLTGSSVLYSAKFVIHVEEELTNEDPETSSNEWTELITALQEIQNITIKLYKDEGVPTTDPEDYPNVGTGNFYFDETNENLYYSKAVTLTTITWERIVSKDELDAALDLKADKSTTYTKTEVDTALRSKQNTLSEGCGIAIENDEVAVALESGASGNILGFDDEFLTLHGDTVAKDANFKTELAKYVYTETEVDNLLAAKQALLTAGNGIDLTSNTISAKLYSSSDNALSNSSNGLVVSKSALGYDNTLRTYLVSTDTANPLQPKLTAGTNITIDSSNVISASGGTDITTGDGLKRVGNVVSVDNGNYINFDTNRKLTIDTTALGQSQVLRTVLTTVGTNQLASKTYVDNLISTSLKRLVVEQLPQNPNTYTIYMILRSAPTTNNIYDEYMYINNAWELIGSTEVDLSNYYTKTETNQTFEKQLATENGITITRTSASSTIGLTISSYLNGNKYLKFSSNPYGLYLDFTTMYTDGLIVSKSTFDNGMLAKQDKLTAGTNITITDNVISASGGGLSYTFTDGLTESSGTVGIDLASGSKLLIDANDKLDVDLSSKQDTIDSTHKLDADNVDDTNTTNKFVSANEKQTWNDKISVPTSSSADNGKFLRVVNGVATWDTVPQAESNSF